MFHSHLQKGLHLLSAWGGFENRTVCLAGCHLLVSLSEVVLHIAWQCLVRADGGDFFSPLYSESGYLGFLFLLPLSPSPPPRLPIQPSLPRKGLCPKRRFS